jgi:diacylglycerol kinase (ATP)
VRRDVQALRGFLPADGRLITDVAERGDIQRNAPYRRTVVADMRTLLLHNPSAGTGHPSPDDLIALLREAGLSPSYHSTAAPDFPDTLHQSSDLVVVAGGDGTVTKVLTQMTGRNVPVAILPLGTANNIARSLGITGTPEDIVAGWRDAGRQRFDIGLTFGPHGQSRFVEAVGVGSLARAMADVDAAETGGKDEVRLSRDVFRKQLADAQPEHVDITVDGEALPGNLLFVEVMNIGYVGPNLYLAPSADPGDGLLDVVYVRADRRAEMLAWLGTSPDRGSPPVDIRQGRRITLTWSRTSFRLGDEFPPAAGEECTMTVALEPEAACVLVPSQIRHGRQSETIERSMA